MTLPRALALLLASFVLAAYVIAGLDHPEPRPGQVTIEPSSPVIYEPEP